VPEGRALWQTKPSGPSQRGPERAREVVLQTNRVEPDSNGNGIRNAKMTSRKEEAEKTRMWCRARLQSPSLMCHHCTVQWIKYLGHLMVSGCCSTEGGQSEDRYSAA